MLLLLLTIKVHTSVEDIDGLDDVENSLLYHNQAIIHYHLRQREAIPVSGTLWYVISVTVAFPTMPKYNTPSLQCFVCLPLLDSAHVSS